MLAVAVGLGVLGVVVLLLGWRGRRHGEGRFCRRCGYDVTTAVAVASATQPAKTLPGSSEPSEGSESSSSDCSECGSDVSQPGAVRIGARASSPRVVVAGVCLAICGAVLAIAVWIPTIIPTSNTPTWLLGRDLDNPNRRGPAIVELETRVADGAVSRAHMDAIAERILAIHAEKDQPWEPELGDLLVDLMLANGAPDDAMKRFARHAVVIPEASVAVRPVVASGAPSLPAEITSAVRARTSGSIRRLTANPAGGLGSLSPLIAKVFIGQEAWINGRPVVAPQGSSRVFSLIGDVEIPVGMLTQVPLLVLDETGKQQTVGPGEHTLEVLLRVEVDHFDESIYLPVAPVAATDRERDSGGLGDPESGPLHVIEQRLTADFRVTESESVVGIRGVRDPGLVMTIQRAMRVGNGLTIASGFDPKTKAPSFFTTLHLELRRDDVPGGLRDTPLLVHKVLVQLGDQTYEMGSMAQLDASWGRQIESVSLRANVQLPTSPALVSHGKLVLHPDPSRTTSFTTSTTYLDEIIDLGWHPIEWQLSGDEAPNIIDLSAWIAAGAVGPMPEAPETTESD
jgi:hypothetical protein